MVYVGESCTRCGGAHLAAAHDGCCPSCRGKSLKFDQVVRLGLYQGLLRSLVLSAKRAGRDALAAALARLLWQERWEQLAALGADVVVPVPMAWTRRFVRGTNCPELLSAQLARQFHVPHAPFLLVARRRTRIQMELTQHQRLQNVQGAFRARRHVDLPGARVLLVDDVLTTGATASEAAKTLRRAGAASVAVAALARADEQ